MIPSSAKALHRFTPESAKSLPLPPCFILQVPNRRLKALYSAELIAQGARSFTRGHQIMRVREIVEVMNPENKAEIVDLIDLYENASDETPISAEALSDWRGLEMKLLAVDPQLRQMVAANRFYSDMAPGIAARIFLAGWENHDHLFQRGADGMMVEALLDTIDETQLYEIWAEILRMMRPSETEEKNSASPQPLSQDQATLPAASEPLTDLPGKSSESDTSETPGSTSTNATSA